MKRLLIALAVAVSLAFVSPVSAGGYKATITLLSNDPDIGETIEFHVVTDDPLWMLVVGCYTKNVFWYKYRVAYGSSSHYYGPSDVDTSVVLQDEGYTGQPVICIAQVMDMTRKRILQPINDDFRFTVDAL